MWIHDEFPPYGYRRMTHELRRRGRPVNYKRIALIGKAFNKATKYVVTHTLDQLDWEKSPRIGGDVVGEVRRAAPEGAAPAGCCAGPSWA